MSIVDAVAYGIPTLPVRAGETGCARHTPDTARLCHDLAQHVAASLLMLGGLRESAGLPDEANRYVEALAEELGAISVTVSREVAEARRQVTLVDLAALVAASVRTAERAHAAAIRISSCGFPRVIGVEHDLRRAIENVLDNACKASPAGRVEVSVAERDGRALIEITDDGPGFGRIPRGTGLGLEQVLSAIQSHGGELEVARPRSGGTTVRLLLPVAGSLAP
jgi:signal transduction histidine kinase